MMNRQPPSAQIAALPSEAKNVCFFRNGHTSTLAWNPREIFSSQSDIAGFKQFVKAHHNQLLIGFISYDIAYELYTIKPKARNDLNLPTIYFCAFDNWQDFAGPLGQYPIDTTPYRSKNFYPTMTREYYDHAFNQIQNYIKSGDIYQVNFSHRLEGATTMPPRTLFAKVAAKNPAEFLAYLEGDGFEILSASPERFIKIQDGIIETFPVKGTRPRGKTPQEDADLKNELLASPKETAELNMITDLLRNDIGKIAKISSVKIVGHKLISPCRAVWHTYSHIMGEINTTPLDVLLSMLPGGSISGCPKKRALEIINELETVQRSVYSGVIVRLDPRSQNLDCSIAIRTIIKKGERLYLSVGGGIVADSTAASEYNETLHKAKPFMDLLL